MTNPNALPIWDLSDLYESGTSPQLKSDLAYVKEAIATFSKKYKGKLAGLTVGQLTEAIKEYEKIEEILAKIASFGFLQYSVAVNKPESVALYQNLQESVITINKEVLFFTLEINRLSEAKVNEYMASDSKYKPWLRDVLVFKPYQLSDAEELLLQEKSITGAMAWNRLFDETLATLEFPFQGAKLGCSAIVNKLSDPNASVRKEAAFSISKVLGENFRIFTLITNTLAKDKAISDNLRGFAHPISSRNLSNYVEDEVVESLINTVKSNYQNLAHRYYKIKAKMMGKEILDYWDRNAPLEEVDEKIEWQDAVKIVLDAYHRFSPKLAALGQKFFDNSWIHAPQEEGKQHGAFAHPTVPSKHPYLLLNYSGKLQDVMTLAHELGHGVHMLLAAKQGMMADTPLVFAETASVFAEQLTFRHMLELMEDPVKKKLLIAKKIEDMLNTVVRQIAFCDFEQQVHAERLKGELSADQICDIWMNVSAESLGPAIHLDEGYRHYWSYIPHFIHSPFYVYSYAFGDCLVNSLYKVYLEKTVEDFPEKYLEMLSAGGTLRHQELLAPFELDASDPTFWQGGLDIVSSFIDQLEM